MSKLSEHPSVKRFRERGETSQPGKPPTVDARELRDICLDAGADESDVVDRDGPEDAGERDDILRFFPQTRSLISFVVRMNREPIHSPARSVANVEFHRTGEHVNETGRKIVAALEAKGIRAINPAMGFPMEMAQVGAGKIWVISHKPVAVAACASPKSDGDTVGSITQSIKYVGSALVFVLNLGLFDFSF